MENEKEPQQSTPERIKEVGSPQGFTFFAERTPDDKPYLGSQTDVSEAVRSFCMGAYEIRSKAGQGEISGEEALKRLNALADEYAAIFYGKKPDRYRAMPFNSPEGLGNFINQRLGMSDPAETAAHTLFMSTANQILAAYEGHQTGALGDDDVRFQIEAAIDDATSILLGLPPEVLDED